MDNSTFPNERSKSSIGTTSPPKSRKDSGKPDPAIQAGNGITPDLERARTRIRLERGGPRGNGARGETPGGESRPGDPWIVGGLQQAGNAAVRALVSLPFGVVTLADRYGPATGEPQGYRAIVEEVYESLAPLRAEAGLAAANAGGRLQMLGTSGTVTTLAGVHMGLARYDRSQVDGCFLDFPTIERITADILAMSLAGRASHPCIGRDRADLVAAGCAILEAICRAWPVGRLRVADRGVREGILFGLMRRQSLPAVAAGA